jgi:hypothetical protein
LRKRHVLAGADGSVDERCDLLALVSCEGADCQHLAVTLSVRVVILQTESQRSSSALRFYVCVCCVEIQDESNAGFTQTR